MSTSTASDILEKIRTRGFWRVVIRPAAFDAEHIASREDLLPIVARSSVRFRGWDYPHVGVGGSDSKSHSESGPDWVGQEIDWNGEVESWRIYQSGQFVHYFAIALDWDHESKIMPVTEWTPRTQFEYLMANYTFREIFEFAARLAMSSAGAPEMCVEIEISGLNNRVLGTATARDRFQFKFAQPHRSLKDTWVHRWQGERAELLSSTRELAARAAQGCFAGFGLNAELDTFKRVQDLIGK